MYQHGRAGWATAAVARGSPDWYEQTSARSERQLRIPDRSHTERIIRPIKSSVSYWFEHQHPTISTCVGPHGLAGLPAGIGAADIFDIVYLTGDSPGEAPNPMRTASYDRVITIYNESEVHNAVVDDDRAASAVSQAISTSDVDMPRLSSRSAGNVVMNTPPVIPERKTPDRRGLTRSRWQRRVLTQNVEEGTE